MRRTAAFGEPDARRLRVASLTERQERELHRFSWGMLSAESAAALRAKTAELMELFDELTRGDEVRPTGQAHTRGSCLLVALREWEPDGFRALRHAGATDRSP